MFTIFWQICHTLHWKLRIECWPSDLSESVRSHPVRRSSECCSSVGAVVTEYWGPDKDVQGVSERMKRVAGSLERWSREEVGDLEAKLKKNKKRVGGVHERGGVRGESEGGRAAEGGAVGRYEKYEVEAKVACMVVREGR